MRIKQPDDLVLWLQLDEGSGTQATDLSNYNNHGKIYGATWTKGIVGNALSFDGVDDYVEVPDSAAIAGSAPFTIELWIYPTADKTMQVVWWGEATKYHLVELGLRSTDLDPSKSIRFAWYGSDFLWEYDWPTNSWQHIVCTWDGKYRKIYYNGELKKYDEPPAPDLIATNVEIAKDNPDVSGTWFNGTIDEVRIYNRALSEEEIKQLYQDGFRKLFKAGERPFLQDYGKVLHLSFNEPSGNKVYDNSGYKNDGTIYGAQRVTSRFGKALRFDGVDDYVDLGDPEVVRNLDSITVSAWFKPDKIKWHRVVAKWDAGKSEFILYPSNNGKVRFYVSVGGEIYYVESVSSYSPGNWYHMVGVYDKGDLKIFINGDIENQITVTSALPIDYNGAKLGIGSSPGTPQYFADGTIDEVRIYNRALSEAEIKQHYYNYLKKHSLEGE